MAVARLPAGYSTVEPVACQDLRDPGRRVVLLVGRLRVGVDAVRQVQDLVPGGLDGLGEAGLRIGVWFGRTDGGQRRQRALHVAVGVGLPSVASGARALRADPDVSRSAFRGEGRFGDERERDHEQRDRPVEEALDAEHDEDGDDDPDPRGAPDRRGSSHRGRRSADAARRRSARRSGRGSARSASPISPAPTNPALGSSNGIAGGQDQPDQQPHDRRGREEAQVGQPVARLHDERV